MHLIILGNYINALSMIPHYGLYAQKKDKSIVLIHTASLPIFITSVISISSSYKEISIPISLSITYFFIFISKYILLKYKTIS